jgi:hypothetical protein
VAEDASVEDTAGEFFEGDAEVSVRDEEIEGRVMGHEVAVLEESLADRVRESSCVEYPRLITVADLD